MSSSTSSSSGAAAAGASAARDEWKVLVALAVVFLLAEAGIRLTERRLSVDIAHIRGAPEVAARLDDGTRARDVLVLGNSSARAGIDATLLARQLDAVGRRSTRIHFFYPDGGNIGVWRWAWRRYFAPPVKQPDLVLVCGAKSHFDDIAPKPVISAGCFVSAKDTPAFLSGELHSLESRLEFLLAKASLSFVHRERVQRRVLDMLMPHNREVLGAMAASAALSAPHSEGSARLAALLADLKAAHTRAIVVTLPSVTPYDVPGSRIAVIQESAARWIDLRRVPGITPRDFHDGAHLNPDGAVKLTSALAQALADHD
ncbi:MAG: hypothetical protein K1X78_27135 [Verrucomicrobiaceae bacterium]|nr:hypothetical protein [Verrucomicrobiaceae bacterium]